MSVKKKREFFGTIVRMPRNLKKDSPVQIRTATGRTVGAILSVCNTRKKVDGSNCALYSEPGQKPWVQWFLLDKKTKRLIGYRR